MEWLCSEVPAEFWDDDFGDMPFHCQQKVLMSLDQGLTDIYGWYRALPGEKKAKAIAAPDFPQAASLSDKLMSFGLSAARKPVGRDGGTAKPGDPCTTDKGEKGIWNEEEKCVPIKGTVNVTFDRGSLDMGEIPGFKGAETNGLEETSCERFVNRVREIATEVLESGIKTKNSLFVRKMWDEFADSGDDYSSDGFKKEFQDFTGSSNQARHYTGGFWAGWKYGRDIGRLGANSREYSFKFGTIWGVIPTIKVKPETASQKADKALNAVSTKHGNQFFMDFKKELPKIADRIRDEVCDY